MRFLSTICAGLAASFLAVAANADAPPVQPPAATEVPVKAVVLFSSGVGYFEHSGTVTGNGSTELRFKTAQINDILKSLVLQDMDGGKVSNVTYPSQDPIEKTLKSFQVDITDNPPLADLLNQLRGAKLTITKSDGSKLNGIVLGVEKKEKLAGDDKHPPVEIAVLNLISGPQIRAIPIDDVQDLQLDDPALQEELTKALTALAQARDQDKKPVTINFRGDGQRHVRIGYVVETPIWKTSYRLIMPSGAQDKPKLQGWAIVENQTDNDWSGVQLSLVSGRPISFVQDLYQPLYIPRPVVQPELFASLNPQTYEGGQAADKPNVMMARRFALQKSAVTEAEAPAARAMDALNSSTIAPATPTTTSPMNPAQSVVAATSAGKIGELFQYTVSEPVTLARQKSAMLPIITDDVECEKLSIYNAAVLPKNPLTGARLKNTTGKHLLQGPITVLEGSNYAGDARIDNVPPGQERLLSYGIDLQMTVNSERNKHENLIQTGKIVKGVLWITRKFVSTQDYVADNKSDHEKTLIVEHPIRPNWQLVDTQKPVETTDALYRFKGTVTPDKTSTLTVKEQSVQQETIALLPADPGQIAFYSRTGEFPQQVRDALSKAVQLRQSLAETDRQIADNDRQTNDITQQQARIRENMKVAATNNPRGEYYKRLETKLNDQETQIEKLKDARDKLSAQHDEQQKQLEDYLNNLNVG